MKPMNKLVAQQRRLAGLDGHAPWPGLREAEEEEGDGLEYPEGPETTEYTTWLAAMTKELGSYMAKDKATRGRGDAALRQKPTTGIKMALDAAQMLQATVNR
jgi:hypothetical protein